MACTLQPSLHFPNHVLQPTHGGELVSRIWIWEERDDALLPSPTKMVTSSSNIPAFSCLPCSSFLFCLYLLLWLFFFLPPFLPQTLPLCLVACPAWTFNFQFWTPASPGFNSPYVLAVLPRIRPLDTVRRRVQVLLALGSRKWCDHNKGKWAPSLLGKVDWLRCGNLLPSH